MSTTTRQLLVSVCALISAFSGIVAQNISLSTQNPTGLYVCGIDQVSITVQNAGGSPAATNLLVSVAFPAGVTYEPGTITGATEFNIANLNAPVFSLADLAGGALANLSFQIQAGCALVAAINSGQQFSNSITATYTGGSKQLTSNNYIVETGLANIISVTPATTTAMKGDIVMRTIKLKNTRQGPIQSLTYQDQHQGGISVELLGGINPSNGPNLYTADIPGSFFAAFGDGDDLLEESDGEITLIEKVTILDCGVPSFTSTSDIIVAWGCGATTCRADSIIALITVLPSNQNPKLVFESIYARPISHCGQTPSVQEITITNTGQAPAENVKVNIYTLDTSFMAFDPTSFEWSLDGMTWQSAPIDSMTPTLLASCNISQYMLQVEASVPLVPVGGTAILRFHSYYCIPLCDVKYPRMRFGFSYFKACPSTDATVGLQNFYPDTAALKVSSEINYNIGHCLEDDSTYVLTYWTKSKRFLVDTGFLQVIIQLPFGFDWDPTCGLNLDGQTPLAFENTIDANGSTNIRAVFDLPFTQDSVGDQICIKYHCEMGLPCQASVPNVPPRGKDYTVYPPPSDCQGCELQIKTYSVISQTQNDTPECGITACDIFTIVVDDICNGGNGGGGGGIGTGGGGGGPLEISTDFDSWRVNRGFQDDNDDRTADNNSKANAPGIRLDRFITGDTLRNQLQVAVISGTLAAVNYRLFIESLTSDFDTLGADAYNLGAGKIPFVNYDSTVFVGGEIFIRKANGQTFNCPIAMPSIRSDQHFIQVAQPNIRPPAIVDQVISMFDQYTFTVDDYINNGCLPQGFSLTAGDSIFFQADYKFTNNFTPLGGSMPPLINFKTSVCDISKTYSWELENFCTEKPIRQFSGYIEDITKAAQRIEPCDVSTETSPFRYDIRIARENMFPFEVRPLAAVDDYLYSLPTNVGLLSTTLTYLKLQEDSLLFANQALSPVYIGNSVQLNLDPFFINPLDEGFDFEISTQFDTTCGYNGTKFGTTILGLQYANECLHNPADFDLVIPNENGYANGSPDLNFFNVGANVVFIPTDNVQLNFTIRNNAAVPALYPWIIIDSDNNLSDVKLYLVDPPNLVPVPSIGGVYQLDTLRGLEQSFFRVIAKSKSCEAFQVKYRFGWGCSPTYNDQSKVCGSYLGTVEIRPQPPELELVIIEEAASVPLCVPSEDYVFEILNANDGSAFNVVPTVKLPVGIRVEPGSSRLDYPAGVSAPVSMPDPVQLPGNVWQFNPQAASAQLAQNGLITFEQEPLNAMRILFKVRAECGAVANSQPVYGAEAIQPCGISANKLRKPGALISINGVNPVNSSEPNLNFADVNAHPGCGETVELTASIKLDGAPAVGDSIYIILPTGTSYVNGSYTPGANALPGPPQVSGQQIRLPLPTNLGSSTILEFTFSIRYDSPAGCADRSILLQVREKTQALCVNTECAVYVATGEDILDLNAQNPELVLNNFQFQNNANGQTSFSANLENAGTATATDPIVLLYHDQNMNGQIDPTDPLVTTINQNGAITPGATLGINGSLNLPLSAYCDLIAVIPADQNCACVDKLFPLGGHQVITEGVGLCNVQSVTVGTDSIPGSTYHWQTATDLSCINCANAVYTPGADVPPGSLVTLVLIETSGSCVIERRFDIQFGGSFGIETQNQTICAGESVTLEASPGGIAYLWSGPGIVDSTLQNQIVTPVNDATYSVTVQFEGNCTGSGSVQVFVKPSIMKAEDLTTCSGTPVVLFPNLLTDVPGVYTRTFAYNGCDSVVTKTLHVPESQTDTTIFICEGNSVVILGDTFTQNGTKLIENIPSASGCDSSHLYIVKVAPNPNIPAQDSVILQVGTEVTLDGPSGFVTYDWAPPGDLSCSDCEDPLAGPDTTTTFILVIKDGNGCTDSISYRVITCNADKYLEEVPNAFTPNGDNANDIFRPLPNEGAEMIVLLQVYDRWGIRVYEGRGENAGWDGTTDGKPAASDVYVYILTVECSGIQKKKSGEITLLR